MVENDQDMSYATPKNLTNPSHKDKTKKQSSKKRLIIRLFQTQIQSSSFFMFSLGFFGF